MYCTYLLFGSMNTEEIHLSTLIIESTRIECSHLINHCRRILYCVGLCSPVGNHHRIGLEQGIP